MYQRELIAILRNDLCLKPARCPNKEDLGRSVASQYLIRHGDLKNFTREEILIIANIARYHRKDKPKSSHKQFSKLSPSAKQVVKVGAALLRVADGLDRSHSGVVTGLSCRMTRKRVEITLKPRGDAELELWGARSKRDFFSDVVGKSLRFKVSPR